jgi:hypothetical protein
MAQVMTFFYAQNNPSSGIKKKLIVLTKDKAGE